MNMKRIAEEIYHKPVNKTEKIRLLNELILDCRNELEAQNENMRPEVKHNMAEGLRLATDYLRDLEGGDHAL